MSGFEKRTEQKKQSIITSARSLFVEFGMSAVSVKDVAVDANVSPVTIFKYFHSKENLVDCAALSHLEHYMTKIESISVQDISFIDKLKKAIVFKSEQAKKTHPEMYQLFVNKVLQGDERFCVYDRRNNDYTYAFFQQGKREGVIRKDFSDEALKFYLSVLSRGASSDELASQFPLHVDAFLDLVCFGFAGEIPQQD